MKKFVFVLAMLSGCGGSEDICHHLSETCAKCIGADVKSACNAIVSADDQAACEANHAAYDLMCE